MKKNASEQEAAARKARVERSAQWQKDHPEETKRNRKKYWRTKGSAKAAADLAANPEKWKADRRRWALKRKYGLTPEDVDRLIEEQRGRCAICRRPLDRPIVDHDHKTNLPRGILCWNCNIALGHFEDDLLRLEAAIAYLEIYSEIHEEVFS